MQTIELFAEITCPFTHVGLHRLVDERQARGVDVPRLVIRAWPLEQINGEPLDGVAVVEKGAALREQVAPQLFAKTSADTFPRTSRPAFALAAAAYRMNAATGEAVSMDIRDALFERGADIADPDVLAKIAERHGVGPVTDVDRASIDADWHEGQQRGVVGSPHFFFGTESAFCPTLKISRPDGRFHIEIDQPRFDEFIALAFSE